MRVCKICGATSNDTVVYGDVCRKHYLQFKRHGRYFERTIRDPNEFVINGDTVEIYLYDASCKHVATTIVDIDCYDLVKTTKWFTRNGYVLGSSPGTSDKVFLHRVIMETPGGLYVDHINSNKLDNRKCNLRNCTKSQNASNRVGRKKVSGVKRVSSGRYQASLTHNYKPIYLGTFDTEREAIEARLAGEKKYFGEYRPSIN